MNKSWIELGNGEQEKWARQYLLKKLNAMTESDIGLSSARRWSTNMSALDFLKLLENEIAKSNEDSPVSGTESVIASRESAQLLLKMMKEAWNQQIKYRKKAKLKSVQISAQGAKWLKRYASQLGITQVEALDVILKEAKKMHKGDKRTTNEVEVSPGSLEAQSPSTEFKEPTITTTGSIVGSLWNLDFSVNSPKNQNCDK